MMRVLLLSLMVLAAMVAFVRFDPAQPPPVIEGILTLARADFAMSDALAPPANGWQPVTLPDSWRERQPHAGGMAWYRVRFSLDVVPTAPQAIYVSRLAASGELWLNGALLTPRPAFTASGKPLRQTTDVPVYVVVPSSALRPGLNDLAIRLFGDADIRSGLSMIRLGPVPILEPVWERQYLLQAVLPYVLAIFLGTAICLAYAYAHRRRQYMIIVVCLVVAVGTVALDLAPALPLSQGDRHAVRALVFSILLWLICRSGFHVSDVGSRGPGRLVDGVWLATMVALAGMVVMRAGSDRVWALVLPLVGAMAMVIALLLATAWRRRSFRLALLAVSAILFGATTVRGLVLPLGWVPWESFRYSAAGAIPLCVVLLLYFGERFVLDREEAVRNQSTAVADERARILQDMHDGMGAHLITAKRLALRPETDRKDLALVIDESLQDLRLIIDSLDVAQGDVLPMLGNLRFRLQPRLAALGIRLTWEAQPIPAFETLSPARALAILRIVQESLNNALRHAQPAEVRFVIRADGADVIIQVIDDGNGFATKAPGNVGRGLDGMRMRAEKMGATLEVDSAPGNGTGVTLRVPLRLRESMSA